MKVVEDSQRTVNGFTLIELLVVLAIVGTLLALVAPRYTTSVERAKEATLKQNLATVRDAIDKHHADFGRYPSSLEDLVSKKYLRRVPVDPLTDSVATWLLIAPTDPAMEGVADIRSGAKAKTRDGGNPSDW